MASQNTRGLNERVYPRRETSPHWGLQRTSNCLQNQNLKGSFLEVQAFRKIGPQFLSSPRSCSLSPHISVRTGTILHQLPLNHTNPRYPEPFLGAQLASFPLSWPMPPALPTWAICPLWKNASFFTLTSLHRCQPLVNWELHEPGISVKNVPEGWSPSPSRETRVPTRRQRMTTSVFLQSAWQRFTYPCS